MKRMSLSTLVLFVMAVALVLLNAGCSDGSSRFDDRDIKIRLVSQQKTDDYRTYSIEVKNTGEREIRYLSFYLYYPILTANGAKSNPFRIEGTVNQGKPVNLKAGESVRYLVFAPIKEVFGSTALLDVDHPGVRLTGYAKDGKTELPFEMEGGYLWMN